ncbi:hypothetical protein F5882DRAFT_103309 [Hyaloscypha sp. PMI_1271]|nr:hypothetical protein F5882DRAFT_103309 [Hyaloscypha sp. PMI_1271]
MSPSGEDPNPWYFGNEMTINGCQGCGSSASASPANDSTKPGKPPTSDRQQVPEDPNATTGTSCHAPTRKHRKSSGAPTDSRNTSQGLKAEIIENEQYTWYSASSPRAPSSALSRGYLVGSFSGQVIREENVPRSAYPRLDNTLRAEYYSSISSSSPDVRTQEQDLTPGSNPENVTPHQGTNNSPGSMDQQGPNVQRRLPKQRNARDIKDPAAEYRQLDIDQDLEENADTDEELS